jgi:hypothetical protein
MMFNCFAGGTNPKNLPRFAMSVIGNVPGLPVNAAFPMTPKKHVRSKMANRVTLMRFFNMVTPLREPKSFIPSIALFGDIVFQYISMVSLRC